MKINPTHAGVYALGAYDALLARLGLKADEVSNVSEVKVEVEVSHHVCAERCATNPCAEIVCTRAAHADPDQTGRCIYCRADLNEEV